MTEAARRDGGAARAPAPPAAELIEEGAKDWGMVVKDVLLGLFWVFELF